MKLTKDEARILSEAVETFKFECKERKQIPGLFNNLCYLQYKLREFGKDKRRTGRTSLNSFFDCLKRFSTNNNTKNESGNI